MGCRCAPRRTGRLPRIRLARDSNSSGGSLKKCAWQRRRMTRTTYLSGISSSAPPKTCPPCGASLISEINSFSSFIGFKAHATWTTPQKSAIGYKAARDGAHVSEDSRQPFTVSMAVLHHTSPSNSRYFERTRTHCMEKPGML